MSIKFCFCNFVCPMSPVDPAINLGLHVPHAKLPLGIAIRGALFALLITNVLIVIRKYIRITYIHSLFEEPFQNLDKIQAIKVIVETYRILQMFACTVHKSTKDIMVLDRTWLRFNFDYPKVKEIPGAPWESLRFVSDSLLSFKHQATFGTETINIYRLDFMVNCFTVQELHGVKHVNKNYLIIFNR